MYPGSHVGNGSGKWWMTVTLSDSVNHPLISKIVEQSAKFNEQPCITIIPFARTDTYLNSFLPSTINLWNSLPESLVHLDDINQFKQVDSSLSKNQVLIS